MANREVYPSSLFPLRGDLSAEAGATAVAVTGLQNIPIAANPAKDGYVPTYTAANSDIEWSAIRALTGTQSNLQNILPLPIGTLYFAYDTGNLFFMTPGFGRGYVQIGDTTNVNDTLLKLLLEIKSMRLAITAIACEGGRNVPQDFDPAQLGADPEVTAADV